jgi:hypothetical protein
MREREKKRKGAAPFGRPPVEEKEKLREREREILYMNTYNIYRRRERGGGTVEDGRNPVEEAHVHP